MQDKATEQFFRDGLFRYAEAHATVAAFEVAAAAKIADIARQQSSRLVLAKGEAVVAGNSVVKGDNGGQVAYAQFPGQFGGEDVVWEMGIWWAHSSDSKKVVVYAECCKGPDHLAKERWATAPESASEKWLAYKGGLHLEMDPGADLDTAFKRLLDEVAKQSETASKRRR